MAERVERASDAREAAMMREIRRSERGAELATERVELGGERGVIEVREGVLSVHGGARIHSAAWRAGPNRALAPRRGCAGPDFDVSWPEDARDVVISIAPCALRTHWLSHGC